MDKNQFKDAIGKIEAQILDEVQSKLPRKVGIIAVNHFRQNFRDAGFINNGIKPWQKTKRQMDNGSDASYTPLTSGRNHLMSSVQMKVGVGEVTIENNVPYAAIHNDGGSVETTVTKKMRKYAWSRVYAIAGKDKLPKELPPEALKWKRLALTKKSKLRINIPKRQFIGDSKELTDKVNKAIVESLEKIKNGIFNH